MSRAPRSNAHRVKRWYRELRAVLVADGGRCRMCGRWFLHSSVDEDGLRLAHLAAYSATRAVASRATCTLACRACDHRMGVRDWTGRVPSLADRSDVDWAPARGVPPFARAKLGR